jgi:hypothetical protein
MSTRRLAAILAADVLGFSFMMEKDDEGTLVRIEALQRETIESYVAQHHGRTVKTMKIEMYFDGFSVWPYGAYMEQEPIGSNDLDLSIRNYHLTSRPHWRADAVVQIVRER